MGNRLKRWQIERIKARAVTGLTAPVDPARLRPDGSYSVPGFVTVGVYTDKPFTCEGCGTPEVWTAGQQKWWYEVAKGGVWITATRCRRCRRVARERKEEARLTQAEGIAADSRLKPGRLRFHYPAEDRIELAGLAFDSNGSVELALEDAMRNGRLAPLAEVKARLATLHEAAGDRHTAMLAWLHARWRDGESSKPCGFKDVVDATRQLVARKQASV